MGFFVVVVGCSVGVGGSLYFWGGLGLVFVKKKLKFIRYVPVDNHNAAHGAVCHKTSYTIFGPCVDFNQ